MVYLFLFHSKKLILPPDDKYLDKRLQCDLIASIDTSSGNFSDIIFKTTDDDNDDGIIPILFALRLRPREQRDLNNGIGCV